jgi:hypothetical protein
MLHLLDKLLRDLFLATIAGFTGDEQVGFQPPDQDWRTHVNNLHTRNALNVYLIDLQDNRRLRTNDRVRTRSNGFIIETPEPVRMDCHYLISAWSPVKPDPVADQPSTMDEHALLYEVVEALSSPEGLNPTRVYPAGSAPLMAWPETYRDHDLATTALPVEGFRQFAEFWQTMGQAQPWKPAVHMVVTLPVPQPVTIAGGIVTTRFARYGLGGDGTAVPEVLVAIGGEVRDALGAAVVGAWVRLETPPVPPASEGRTVGVAATDADGRFTFDRLRRDRYRLRVRAAGLGEAVRDVDIPAPTGQYLVQFP